jgi:hypothetical protein
MSESVQPETSPETVQKYAFGVICTHCGQPVQHGLIWLKNDAQLEDLRNAPEQALALHTEASCVNLDSNGRVCNESNIVERDDLVFVGDSMQVPNTQANAPWRE